MKNYDAMTIAELEQEIERLGAEGQAIRDEKKTIQDVLDRKRAEQAAAVKVAGMGDAEKEALRQALQTEGIASGEAVGTPGA